MREKDLRGCYSAVVCSDVFAQDKSLFSSQPDSMTIICWRHTKKFLFISQPSEPETKHWHPSVLTLELSTQHSVLLYSADSNENNLELAMAKLLQ